MSANQRYKQSGTTKSFKEWLKDEQMKGQLEVHEKEGFINANGEDKPVLKKGLSKNTKVVLGLLAITLIGVGAYRLRGSKNG
jgi:hypothetical protein